MSRASELIRIFESIADLLELKGEDRFKPAAYRRASRSLESLGEEIEPTAERGALGAIPGVGPAIEAKIREYLTTGSIAYFEALRAEFPAGVLELLKVPGIGPKTARRMLLDLGIDGPTSLLAAIDAGRLAGRAGFGEKKIAALHAALAERIGRVEPAARHPLLIAWELAERVLSELRDRVRVDYLGAAGSLRRGRETVGDLDLLATSSKPAEVFEAFSALPGIRSVRLRGETKETVVFEPGIQIDLRVVAPESLGAALQYFTGSKEHNIRIRSLARELGLKINEYGVFRGDERLPTPREEDLYAALGLSWVPPELREDRGEIEAARAHRIPPIVAPEAIRGDLHLHLPGGVLPDRPPWTAAAGRLGLEYLGWVLAPGEFLPTGRAQRLPTGAGSVSDPGRSPLLGVEIGPASLGEAVPPGVDYRILRPVPGDPMAPTEGAGENPPLFVAHLPAAGDPNRAAWIRWARREGVGLEVNPDPGGEGLDSGEIRQVVEGDGSLFLSSRAGGPGALGRIVLSVRIARRGGAGPAVVATTGAPVRASGTAPASRRGPHRAHR